jgi:hypothetical protein
MIPTIGIMIGAYILMRCFEVFCRAKSYYSGGASQTVLTVAAVLVILLTAFSMASLATTGVTGVEGLAR